MNNEVYRRDLNEYSSLNSCLNFLVMSTSQNGNSYFCGYDCKTTSSGGEDCTKVMGNPRHMLSGSAEYFSAKRKKHEDKLNSSETKDELLRRMRAEAYE